MSIKIEGGRGSRENVFSDSDSGMPLWNGKPLLNLFYPVGSIYWSSNNTNPGTLFGGTWTQIKDKFILAAGDYYSNGATGGAATVTLTVSNMPSHSHSFTPSGNVSSHSHSFTPSGTVGSHTHTGPSHTHSFTPSGTVSSSFSGTKGTINVSGGNHRHPYNYRDIGEGSSPLGGTRPTAFPSGNTGYSGNLSMSGTFTPSGTVSSSFSGTAGTTGADGAGNTGATQPSFSGTAGTTSATQPSFSGTAGNTGSSGSGSSFSILPPYIVKYCWERTA